MFPVGVDLGRSKSLNFSCYWMAFDYRGFMNENQKALGVKDDFLVFL